MATIASCLSRDNDVFVFWKNEGDLSKISQRFSLDLSKIKLTENIFAKDFPFLKKLIKSMEFDVIIFLSDGSIPLLLSKKLILHMQQPISYRLSLKDKLKLKRLDKIICNSIFTKDFIEENYHRKCEILYPPVTIVGKGTKKENIILHIGRFRVTNVKTEDYKKQQTMIDMFKKLMDGGLRGWKFLIAVSLEDTNDEKFVRMRNSAKGYPIEFLINASHDKLWKEGAKAKIYWHATGYGEDLSKNPHLAEHFGISTVEAMGAGVVPVVISAGGQLEIVKDGENGFLWNDLSEFEQKTLRLINDEKLLSKMAESASYRAREFSEENFCKKIQEIVNE